VYLQHFPELGRVDDVDLEEQHVGWAGHRSFGSRV
jgi:hypothetical protein